MTASAAVAQLATPEQQRLLAISRVNPTDYDATYAYAKESIDVRDYEAAIAALERLLVFNPKLTRAKYELGVLYFRLRSWAAAERYLLDTLASPDTQPDIRARIDVMLPQVRKELQQSRFYGVIAAGFGASSNATMLPGAGTIRAFGVDVPAVNRPFTRGADTNAFALASITHIYDFDRQDGTTLETHALGYATRQFRFDGLSPALGEISIGPRFLLSPGQFLSASVRPYVVAAGASVGSSPFSSSVGGGVSLLVPVSLGLSFETSAEWRRQHTNDSALPGSQDTLNTGSLWTGRLGARYQPTDSLTFNLSGFYLRNPTSIKYLTTRHAGVDASVKIDFAPPFETIGTRWSVTPFVSYANVRFDAGNPFVDPNVARRDWLLRSGLQFEMPITPMFGVTALLQYARNTSNIVNYRYDSWSALIGPTLRF